MTDANQHMEVRSEIAHYFITGGDYANLDNAYHELITARDQGHVYCLRSELLLDKLMFAEIEKKHGKEVADLVHACL